MGKSTKLIPIGDVLNGVVKKMWDRTAIKYTNEDLWWIAENSPEPACNWALAELLRRQKEAR